MKKELFIFLERCINCVEENHTHSHSEEDFDETSAAVTECIKETFPEAIFFENPGPNLNLFSNNNNNSSNNNAGKQLVMYPRRDSFEVSVQFCDPTQRHISATTTVYSKLETGLFPGPELLCKVIRSALNEMTVVGNPKKGSNFGEVRPATSRLPSRYEIYRLEQRPYTQRSPYSSKKQVSYSSSSPRWTRASKSANIRINLPSTPPTSEEVRRKRATTAFSHPSPPLTASSRVGRAGHSRGSELTADPFPNKPPELSNDHSSTGASDNENENENDTEEEEEDNRGQYQHQYHRNIPVVHGVVPKLGLDMATVDEGMDGVSFVGTSTRIYMGLKALIRDLNKFPENVFIQSTALRVLWTLGTHAVNVDHIRELGGAKCCVTALRVHRGKPKVVKEAAILITRLTQNVAAREQLSMEGAVEELSMVLEANLDDGGVCKAACEALKNLCIQIKAQESLSSRIFARKQVEDSTPRMRRLFVDSGGVTATLRALIRHHPYKKDVVEAALLLLDGILQYHHEPQGPLAVSLLANHGAREAFAAITMDSGYTSAIARKAMEMSARIRNRPTIPIGPSSTSPSSSMFSFQS